MEIVFLLVGILLGTIITWLYLKNTNKSSDGSLEIIRNIETDKIRMEERFNSLQLEFEKSQLAYKQQTGDLENKLQEEREKLNNANSRLAKAEQIFESQKEKLSLQKQEMEELQKKFNTEFENIANRLLTENSSKFTEQNQKNIDNILSPLKEKISQFEKKVEESYEKEMRDKISLREEVKKLYELNAKISTEANNLTKALKGDNKKQGNWGEVILEKILEKSGLVRDQEYKTQVYMTDEEGKRLQPDVIVFLPDNKHIVIDAKVSLLAYDSFVNEELESEKERHKKDHILSLRNHIKILSEKNYQTNKTLNTPDFVLLFIPIESSFSIAVQADIELFNYAWDRKIVVVSPTTLLATLRTISSVWKQERQNRNAWEIAEQSGKLYDKFAGFTEDMLRIGERIDNTQKVYDEAMKKLSRGSGNIIGRVENLRKLGAKSTKVISEKLLETGSENLLQE